MENIYMGKIKKMFTPVKLDDGDNIPDHRVNKRVNLNLNTLTDIFHETMGNKFVDVEKSMLKRTITCSGFTNLDSFTLDYYRYENRLWTFNYNLRVRSTIDVSNEQLHETNTCVFHCEAKGRTKTKNARWTDAGLDCSDAMEEIYLQNLNTNLIMDRISALDITDLWLRYDPGTMKWSVEFFTIIGSSVWMLIPPLNQLIKPTAEDCARMIELMQLCFTAVLCNDATDQLRLEYTDVLPEHSNIDADIYVPGKLDIDLQGNLI